MTNFTGADTQALAQLAVTLKAKAELLGSIQSELNQAVHSSTWLGPDASDFTSAWSGTLRGKLVNAETALHTASQAALRNALQQDETSDSTDRSVHRPLHRGISWSDIINSAQELLPKDTVDDIGGYATNVDPSAVAVDAGNGKSAADIYGNVDNMAQGKVGDCWMMSALAATAQRDPEFMDRHINANPDGTWTVTLYEDGKPVNVVVAPGDILKSGAKNQDGSYGWMSVYEAAALKHHGGQLYKIVADTPAAGLEMVTGRKVDQRTVFVPSPTEMERYMTEGRPITTMSDPLMPWRKDVAAAHVYIVESYDRSSDTVTLVNPWGSGSGDVADRVTMSRSEWQANFPMTGVGPSSRERNQG